MKQVAGVRKISQPIGLSFSLGADMVHPVFISFASEDIENARKIGAAFPDDIVYLYERVGVEGANWPLEIEEEVRSCECFVVLWSKNYIVKEWARREMALAAGRVRSNGLGVWVIIQLDDLPLETKCINPLTGNEEDMLAPFRAKYRSVAAPFRTQVAKRAIGNALARVRPTRLPKLPRLELQEQLRRAISIDYRYRTAILFVSGLNGNGRKTLIESVMENDYPHLTGYIVPLDAADGPEDLLMRLWLDVLMLGLEEARRRLTSANNDPAKIYSMLNAAVKEFAQIKAYLVITFDVPSEYVNSTPGWFRDALGKISSGFSPIIFVVLTRRVADNYVAAFTSAQSIFVHTLEENESRELAWRLVQAVDSHPARWKDENIAYLAQVGGGSPELVKDISIMAAREPTLDFLEQKVNPVVERFSEYLSGWVSASLGGLGETLDHGLLVLKLVDRLGVADLQALKEIVGGNVASVGATLYVLRDSGLLEQLSDGIWRIPPLLRRRLNIHLTTWQLRETSDECLRKFADKPLHVQDEYGATYLVNALSAKITNDTKMSEEEASFVSVTMIFRAGLQSYRLGEYPKAYKIFRRAFERLENIRDEDTKIELIRYFSLSSIREKHEWDAARNVLGTKFTGGRFEHKAKSIKHFLIGFAARLDGEFEKACEEFKLAYENAKNGYWSDRQRAIILNEWVRAYLYTNDPDYSYAVSLARESCGINLTPFTQDVLVRTLIMRTYRQKNLADHEISRGFEDIEKEMSILERKCEQAGQDFHRLRKVDLREQEAFENKRDDNDRPLNLNRAIRAGREAYDHNPRHDTLVRIWQVTYLNEVDRDLNALHKEVQQFLDDNHHASNRHKGHAAYYLITTTDVSTQSGKDEARRLLNQYRKTLPKRNVDALNGYIQTGVLQRGVSDEFDAWREN